MHSSPIKLTLVLCPTSPRDITLHIVTVDELKIPSKPAAEPQSFETPETPETPETLETLETPETDEQQGVGESESVNGKKRTRRTKAQIAADEAAAQSVEERAVDSLPTPANATAQSLPPEAPAPVTATVPTKEHAEPKGTPEKSAVTYSHDNKLHRQILIQIITDTTGLPLAIFKNTPDVYAVVKKFQASIEDVECMMFRNGNLTLSPEQTEILKKSLQEVIGPNADDIY